MASANDTKKKILGYGFMLEESLCKAFKKEYSGLVLRRLDTEEITERPTIDITNYGTPRCVPPLRSSENGSYFQVDIGFKKNK